MPMATPAARAPPPGLLSKTRFLVPSPNAAAVAATTVRVVGRRGVTLGAAPRSVPRDGEWGADPDPSAGTGRMVDQDMPTLRRRIREARAALSEDDDIDGYADADAAAPGLTYGTAGATAPRAGVRGAVWLLEALVLNSSPGLVAGALATLLLLGVPASAFLVCAKLIQVVDAISSIVNGR